MAVLALAGCRPAPTASPAAAPRYTVGAPYEMGGVWSYPRADTTLVQSGLATILPDRRAGRRTADGEIHDPAALVAAHRTLQLPSILEVTNLENGRSLLVRANDRGPAPPGRVIGLSRRAAELLGVRDGTQVRVAVRPAESQALAAALPGEENAPPAVAAPRGAVATEALPPPPGARAAERVREAAPLARPAAGVTEAAPVVPDRLPEQVAQGAPSPGSLYVEAGTFSRRDMAARQAASLAGAGATVQAGGPRGREQFRVRIGPLPDPAAADRTLEQVLRSGVSEARITVE
nr:RlpA-like double-psi beta-barrel domain-containing protein [Roseomonas acroporae]